MAVIKRGILGGFSNKIGNIVGTSWKGIAVMKSLPLSVANPQTAGQVEQRNKFKVVSKLGSQLLSGYVKPLWDRFAQNESGYNAFVRHNIAAYEPIDDLQPDIFKLSIGKLDAVTVTSCTKNVSTGLVTINWTNNAGTGLALATDQVYVVGAVNDFSNPAYFVKGQTGRVRSDTSATVQIPVADITETIYIFLSFKRVDGSMVSTSIYASPA